MRFLADESCDFAVVRALHATGHDVLAVAEIAPRADDAHVIRLAVSQQRVLLTEDKDFGQLVFAHGTRAHGVVLLLAFGVRASFSVFGCGGEGGRGVGVRLECAERPPPGPGMGTHHEGTKCTKPGFL